jgi:hypothetical protein
MPVIDKRTAKKFIGIAAIILLVFFILSLVAVNVFVEPSLRKKLHTLIIQGSDSLYTYSLGQLNANFFGGNIEVDNLQIQIDSNHYKKLELQQDLPSLTMELKLGKGYIKGVSVFSLLVGKKITIQEIGSRQADIKLSRHLHQHHASTTKPPLWKAIQPTIAQINIDRIRLDGLKMLYKSADTAESVKLQFDRIDAHADRLRIDSLASVDTNRIGFAEEIYFKVHDLKYRTSDSSYKMKAEWITFSSKDRTIEIDSFKLQPTLKKEDFYQFYGVQASLYYLTVDKARFTGLHFNQFIHDNIISVDSVVMVQPKLSVYLDKGQERKFKSKIGSYPHQKLLAAASPIDIRAVSATGAEVAYTEKNGTTGEEGTLNLDKVDLLVKNATNMPGNIRKDAICTVQAKGNILQGSPISVDFRFFLDSSNGRFDAQGSVDHVTAAQINKISIPMANTNVTSLNVQHLEFKLSADDYNAWSDVKMRYSDLSVVLNKTDEKTGAPVTRKFITNLLNKYVLWHNNPMPGQPERVATHAQYYRLTTQSFFGVIWKSIFAGMQNIMLKSG